MHLCCNSLGEVYTEVHSGMVLNRSKHTGAGHQVCRAKISLVAQIPFIFAVCITVLVLCQWNLLPSAEF